MSGYVEIRLREFIRQVEDDLPWECPKCDGDLAKIRYATDCHRRHHDGHELDVDWEREARRTDAAWREHLIGDKP